MAFPGYGVNELSPLRALEIEQEKLLSYVRMGGSVGTHEKFLGRRALPSHTAGKGGKGGGEGLSQPLKPTNHAVLLGWDRWGVGGGGLLRVARRGTGGPSGGETVDMHSLGRTWYRWGIRDPRPRMPDGGGGWGERC